MKPRAAFSFLCVSLVALLIFVAAGQRGDTPTHAVVVSAVVAPLHEQHPPTTPPTTTPPPPVIISPTHVTTLKASRSDPQRYAPAPAPPSPHVAQAVTVNSAAFWQALGPGCESSDGRTSANGKYYGYFQFTLTSWHEAGGTGVPMDHDYGYQRDIAIHWAHVANPWGQWPVCWPRTWNSGLRPW